MGNADLARRTESHRQQFWLDEQTGDIRQAEGILELEWCGV